MSWFFISLWPAQYRADNHKGGNKNETLTLRCAVYVFYFTAITMPLKPGIFHKEVEHLGKCVIEISTALWGDIHTIYYPPEVRRREYWGVAVIWVVFFKLN